MKHYRTHLVLFSYVFLSSAASGTPRPTCSFSGKSYEAGETWHRRLENSGSIFCVSCRCKEEGAVNCSSVSCDNLDCKNRDVENEECCRFCQVSVELPPVASPQVSCLHNGRVYQDSQTFTSNSTGLQTHSPNQCVQCVCQAGQVLCRLKTCPSLQCTQPIDPNDCCPCQGGTNKDQLEPSSVLVTFLLSQGTQTADCTSGGITYAHGSSWHPVIGPLGQMDCVICKCKSGRIECGRLSCPQPPSCVKLQPVQGQCCPICIDKISVVDHETAVTESKTEETKEVVESFMCLPRPSNTIVYRSHASSSISGYYQYAFQIIGTNKNTRLLSWTVKDGQIGDFSEQHLSKDEFVILTHTFKFKLLGATRSRFMEKFIRKAKKLPDKCGSRCSAKINRLERVLHLKEFLERHQCLPTEIKFE
ncbi:chordin-like protein 1 isoform X1 [Centruroides sculpturatus]|uniref:chordin-like protein 1 isoform X1 n=1 Tax=Centruroides sculpturatus TaxID=218467 RepID=UPI000C6EB1C6|nr:chordin-like protein 1 isoform X1 [Centruroides sculpturatus]XP_023227581.1 chordin-like protein 1 isoform X1 [Centruroides sculpturatus]XP_023227582.1 chordin-like protein 1 isoform X1 [Centruroides sculpturatus]